MSLPPGGSPANQSGSQFGYPAQANNSYMSWDSVSSSAYGEAFTAKMKDRQARGKDPYHSGDGSDGGSDDVRAGTKLRLGKGRADKDDFFLAERRQKAIAFLDNPELLMMHAQSTGETIPATRLHFMKQLCGYDEEEQDPSFTYSNYSYSRPSTDKRRGSAGPRSGNN